MAQSTKAFENRPVCGINVDIEAQASDGTIGEEQRRGMLVVKGERTALLKSATLRACPAGMRTEEPQLSAHAKIVNLSMIRFSRIG